MDRENHPEARVRSKPSPFVIISSLVGIQVLFGVNYSVSKVLVDTFPPLMWASIRGMVAAIAMIALSIWLGRSERLGRSFMVPALTLSLLGVVINQGCFLVGLRYTTSANSAILNSSIPLITLLFLILKRQEHFTWRRTLGALLACLGVLILLRVEHFTLSDKTMFGDTLTLINCISFSLYLALSKRFLAQHDPFWATGWLFFLGSIGLTVVSIPEWPSFRLPPMTGELWACIAYAIVAGTILVYFLNNWLLSHIDASRVASFIYLQPLVASVLGFAWLGEPLTVRTLFSGALIVCGVVLTSKVKPSMPRTFFRRARSRCKGSLR